MICGRYEGVDERVNETLVTDEMSIGDYVLSGGEPAAVVVVDSIVRLLPGRVRKRDIGRQRFVFKWACSIVRTIRGLRNLEG